MTVHFDLLSTSYVESYSSFLKEHYFTGFEEEYLKSDAFQHDVNEHVFRRTTRFRDHLVPWVQAVHDLKSATVLEVGSGTGASTLAFAPYVKEIYCYEIDEKATRAAKERMKFWELRNVHFEEQLFCPQARFVQDGRKADVVLFITVLEHMTYGELETALRTAYRALRPGGIIVVAETPNRLSVFDYHSSWMPFYQWLPPAVRERYFDRSPRQHFVYDVGAVKANNPFHTEERLTRWGNGVSFHDFELALGNEVHNWIVADGWEDAVRPLAPIFKDDELLLDIFERWEIKAHRAFARSWLYLIIKRPVDQKSPTRLALNVET